MFAMQKKIVLAIDSFKGSATSFEIESFIETGIKSVLPDTCIVKIPIADGGEGTVASLVSARNGIYKEITVKGPLGKPVNAIYGMLDSETAVMEMAAASGITLVDEAEKDPFMASTYGTGEMILDAVKNGAKRIYIGIGGSATNDGGIGMARALGVRFLTAQGKDLSASIRDLEFLDTIDISGINPAIKNVEIHILSDVDNPLCGEKGASAIYGPQKGASKEDIPVLDHLLEKYAKVIDKDLGIKIKDHAGAGAAGGLGAGLMVFVGATMARGIESILGLVELEQHLHMADLVVTGEGRMDEQSVFGKAPMGIAKMAQQHNVPVMAVVGSAARELDRIYEVGLFMVLDLVNEPMNLDTAVADVKPLAERAGKTIGYMLRNYTDKR